MPQVPPAHVAKVEDYDDAADEPVKGTAVEAKRSSKQQLDLPITSAASDSGYSSALNGSQLSTRNDHLVVRRPSNASPTKYSKRNSLQAAPAEYHSRERERDPYETNSEWRYTSRFDQQPAPAQSPRTAQVNPNMAYFPPPHDPSAGQMRPPPVPLTSAQPIPTTRRRLSSSAGTRPVSYHAGSSYTGNSQGPPISYWNNQYSPHPTSHYPPQQPTYGYAQPSNGYFGPGPSQPIQPHYQAPPQSPHSTFAQVSPTSPAHAQQYAARPSSAMQSNAAYDQSSKPHTEDFMDPRQVLNRSNSRSGPPPVRQPVLHAPVTDLRSEYATDGWGYEDDERRRTAMTRTSPRPLVHHAATQPQLPTKGILRVPSSNESRPRHPHSDAGVISRGDTHYASTAHHDSQSQHSHFQSTSSSDFTPRSRPLDHEELVCVEFDEPDGRKRREKWPRRKLDKYLAKLDREDEEIERVARHMRGLNLDHLEQKTNRIEDYVKASGTDRVHVTAEAVREANNRASRQGDSNHKRSNSHVSGRSRRSGSHMTSGTNFVLTKGGQSLTISGDARIQRGDEGAWEINLDSDSDSQDDADLRGPKSIPGRRRHARRGENYSGEGHYEPGM